MANEKMVNPEPPDQDKLLGEAVAASYPLLLRLEHVHRQRALLALGDMCGVRLQPVGSGQQKQQQQARANTGNGQQQGGSR